MISEMDALHCVYSFALHPNKLPPRKLTHCFPHRTILTSLHKQQHITRRILLRTLSVLPFSFLPPPTRSYCLPPNAAQSALAAPFPDTWPYASYDFARYDKAPDPKFYLQPRFTRHIDDRAIDALKAYYASQLLPNAVDILDLCSSVESYISPSANYRVTGLGMNDAELRRNPALDSFSVRDLNADPHLPYSNNSFDLALCALSIDYLTRPRDVLQQVCRVLRPGGHVVIAFSNRVFATKAVALWMSGSDLDHIYTVAAFIHFAGGFSPAQVVDLSPRRRGSCIGDPLYVVSATKLS